MYNDAKYIIFVEIVILIEYLEKYSLIFILKIHIELI